MRRETLAEYLAYTARIQDYGRYEMFRCKFCGNVFAEPTYKSEIDGFDENDREIVMQTFSCPYCGDTEIAGMRDDDDLDYGWYDKMMDERKERASWDD